MNLLLAITIGTGATLGALGMLALIVGGIAAAMIDSDGADTQRAHGRAA